MMLKPPHCPICNKELKTRRAKTCNTCAQNKILTTKGLKTWTPKTLAQLQALYATTNINTLVEIFGISKFRIYRKAKKLKLAKITSCTTAETLKLRLIYASATPKELIQQLPRHEMHAIYQKAYELGLKRRVFKRYLEATM